MSMSNREWDSWLALQRNIQQRTNAECSSSMSSAERYQRSTEIMREERYKNAVREQKAEGDKIWGR